MLVIVRHLAESLVVGEQIHVTVAGLRRKRVCLELTGSEGMGHQLVWSEEGNSIQVTDGVVITPKNISHGRVSLAIDAPRTTRIRRSEVLAAT